MERLLGLSVGGDAAVDIASIPVRMEQGGVHLDLHPASWLDCDPPEVKTPHRTDHDSWNASERDITEEAVDEAPPSETSHDQPRYDTTREIHLFPTGRLSQHRHVQRVASWWHMLSLSKAAVSNRRALTVQRSVLRSAPPTSSASSTRAHSLLRSEMA